MKKPTWHFKGDQPTYVDIGGLSLPFEAVDLGIELEGRGIRFRVDGDTLKVSTATGERPDLSTDDKARIVKWKPHLIELQKWIDSLETEK